MAYLINNSSIISDTRKLQNLATTDPVPSIWDLDGWSKGTDYSRGGFSSWSAGTENLSTQSVQPTTNDFSEAVLRLNCDLISSGTQTWTGIVSLKFQNQFQSQTFTLVPSGTPISSGSRIYVYMAASDGRYSATPYLICQSFIPDEDTGGNANEEQSPYNQFTVELFDFTTYGLEISWPTASTTTMSWDAQMFWK